MTEENTFDQMELENNESTAEYKPTEEKSSEVDMSDLDDTPIGEKKSYEREPLDGEIVTIISAKLFSADTSEPPKKSMSGKTTYYPCSMLVTYDKQNKDGVNHREYYSGARQFVQRSGDLSGINVWYDGSETQTAELWEAVAKFKNKNPDQMSVKEFYMFLNDKPKAKLYTKKGKFQGKPWEKNLVLEFVQE